MEHRLCLIVNPAAGNGRALNLLPHATAALEQAGIGHRLVESASLGHAKELAAQAAERGEVVVAVGGDGMAGALAGVAASSGTSYGIIPAGRGNDLARVLGIPADPAEAARVLATGKLRRIDLIEVSAPGHLNVIVAGSVYAGLPAVAGALANSTRWLGGSLVYPVSALRVLARWHPVRFDVDVAGVASGGEASGHDASGGEAAGGEAAGHHFEGYALVVANSAYFGGGMKVAPTAMVDDGMLDLVLMRHAPKLAFVRALLKIKDGSHVALPQVSLERGADVTITMSRDLPAAADGEPLACAGPLPAGTPLRVRVLPDALQVFVPA